MQSGTGAKLWLLRALNELRDIRATPGRIVCTLPVTKRVQNRYNTLHGGCIGAHLLSTLLSICEGVR